MQGYYFKNKLSSVLSLYSGYSSKSTLWLCCPCAFTVIRGVVYGFTAMQLTFGMHIYTSIRITLSRRPAVVTANDCNQLHVFCMQAVSAAVTFLTGT